MAASSSLLLSRLTLRRRFAVLRIVPTFSFAASESTPASAAAYSYPPPLGSCDPSVEVDFGGRAVAPTVLGLKNGRMCLTGASPDLEHLGNGWPWREIAGEIKRHARAS